MLPKINPTRTKAWQLLKEHYEEMKHVHLKERFKEDAHRFDKFSLSITDILWDHSKNIITDKTVMLLLQLAEECGLSEGIKAMFAGQKINETENRAVLHTALRNFSGNPILVEGKDIMPGIQKVQGQMKELCTNVHNGAWKGYSGKPIKYIVNIGIGGSCLGPMMVSEALKPYWKDGIKAFFVSNVDGSEIAEALKEVNPEETLFLIASKTFTTQETMANANTAREWFLKSTAEEKDVPLHFIAISTNKEKVKEFGIAEENIFVFWDWVGGRYSIWSAIGLSVALTIGYDNFEELLKGGEAADIHFSQTAFPKNIPVLMGLISIWYINFFGAKTEAILPYDQYLHYFPAFLQQASMESNGKYMDRNGEPVTYSTAPIVWGEAGTNGQHAFYQLIHQGTQMVPCDFIAPSISHNPLGSHHKLLLSNFFAQTEALMNGRSANELAEEATAEMLIPYKTFQGGKPSNSFLIKEITPFTLGELIALYEHKIFVQGLIWNIFSFDQWGVELGKRLADKVLPELNNIAPITTHDSSTNGLINTFKTFRS